MLGIIYALYVEKAFLVNKMYYKGPRLGHPLFRKLLAMWCVYGVLFVLLCFNAIAEYTPQLRANGTLPERGVLGNATLLDGFCSFYVKAPASVPLLVYDLIFTSTLVHWFVTPLLKSIENAPVSPTSNFHEAAVKTAKKAFVAARITLLASFFNLLSLVLFAMVRHLFSHSHAHTHAAALC